MRATKVPAVWNPLVINELCNLNALVMRMGGIVQEQIERAMAD